ncbi:MAG: DUF1269 domain-containing protein [Leptolyngbya sp. SIOISBB]|nr:DUF1269 domain-containing protein [Leptolyngbya sp. SIOISBB]
MTDAPVQLLIASFNDEKAANEAMKTLRAAKRQHLIGIQKAAVLRRNAKGKLHIAELKDFQAKTGAKWGGALGAAIGLVTGPGIIAAGATGAVIGALANKLKNSGFAKGRIKILGEALPPETSALVAVIEHTWVADLQAALEDVGATVMAEALQRDLADQLEAGREVAYTAFVSEGGMAAGRLSAGESDIEVMGFLADDESIEFVEAGVAVEAIDVEFVPSTDTPDEPAAEA